MKRNHIISSVWFTLLGIGIIAVDQYVKFLVMRGSIPDQQVWGVLSFEQVLNRGIAFGMFYSHHPLVFMLIGILLCAGLCGFGVYMYNRAKAGASIIGGWMILSGALSNMIDRVIYGGVVDFIKLSYAGYVWPYFNIADMVIVLGVLVMIATYKEV